MKVSQLKSDYKPFLHTQFTLHKTVRDSSGAPVLEVATSKNRLKFEQQKLLQEHKLKKVQEER